MRGIRKADTWGRAASAAAVAGVWLFASFAQGQQPHSSPPPQHQAPQPHSQPSHPPQQAHPPQPAHTPPSQSHSQPALPPQQYQNRPAPQPQTHPALPAQNRPYQPQSQPFVPSQGPMPAPQGFVPHNTGRPVYPGPPYLGPTTPRPTYPGYPAPKNSMEPGHLPSWLDQHRNVPVQDQE
jgi:hypothetical protein